MPTLETALATIAEGLESNPFAFLGPHSIANGWTVRTFQPQAERVELLDANGVVQSELEKLHPQGVFGAELSERINDYRFRVFASGTEFLLDDPYRFDSPLGEMDRHLIGEGTHYRLYDKLGAQPKSWQGAAGVHFALWAPNAKRVSVVGPFNHWDGRCHPMRLHPANGVWDLFIPGLADGVLYKFELVGADGQLMPLKADPFARRMEPPPGNAAVVYSDQYRWGDQSWMLDRAARTSLDGPIAIYEVHLGSWRRHTEDNGYLSYRELAGELVPYVRDMGYTHIELLPVTEHPFDGSWGYQPIGLFAPTWRFGSPEDFKYFIDTCHRHEIGVIVDWVPAHFPRDEHGLGYFDGTHLYEHSDPRQGAHQDWGTLIFNFDRKEVANYLLASALFWVEEFHIDALRVDAVASMLYLDYSREPGQWIPNEYGGNENLGAIDFLRRVNEQVHAVGATTMAEESTAWPQVSRPVYLGGLGFGFKWNMGWMHDTLDYFQKDPIHRCYHHDKLTFGLLYAFSENFILPLSHDEVVHGKGSLLARMPGDDWQQFANLRMYYAFMYAHPGKKLLFMGGEFAQGREWDHASSLDWALLDIHWHHGVQQLVRDLNALYRASPALYELDFDGHGFEWIDCTDHEQSVIAFIRRGKSADSIAVIVGNFTPVAREGYRIGVPKPGCYFERVNTDAAEYSGSGIGNEGRVDTEPSAAHGYDYSLSLTLPPLGVLILTNP